MRKRLFTPTPEDVRPPDKGWLDLDRAASVEVTSEEKDYEIDSALVSGEKPGWRAATPGVQTIRLLFDQGQRLRRIALVFEEKETARTQEFVLRWSPDGRRSFREIVRQQWNFSFFPTAAGICVRPGRLQSVARKAFHGVATRVSVIECP
jgi:hypothetical protein